MDAHHFYDYGVTGSDLSYSSYPTISSLPNRLPGASKFDSENSPISPLANYLDSETFTTLSDCQEQHSSTENLSGASSSSNSSLDYNHYFHRPSPSPDCLPEGLLVLSGGNAVLHNAVHSQNMQRALLQLESALMGPDEEVTKSSPSYGGNKAAQTSSQRSRTWTNESKVLHQNETQRSQISLFITRSGNGILSQERDKVLDDLPLHGVPSNNLKQLLIACARVLAENKLDDFEVLITKARTAVSITGDPIQRLGAYILEGLVARKELSGTTIYRSLRCKEPAGNDLLSYMHILYEICPYLKFGYMAANGAIAEACRNENYVHIIDFQIAQGTQWMTLLQALAARPGGAPYVRITGIDDPVSQYARGDGLAAVEKRLSAISEKFNIAVEFNAVPVFAPEVTKAMLDVRPGEAVAVNFPLQLHHIPDESVDVNNPRDELIRMIKSLCPKIVTLVEQESNTNTAPFFPRFLEALDYYHAMFESIDVTLARDRKERINVEQHCLARDIVNVIACEGKERVERHELLGKWKSRFMMAGFRQYPLSSYVNSVIKDLMRRYSEHYTLVEKDGAMLLGWKERNLISASAWY